MNDRTYVLGTHRAELERLELQQRIWSSMTQKFLDRLEIREGWRCLDVGCGPGFVSLELARRVGARGRVVAVDAAEHWLAHLDVEARSAGLDNIETRSARIEQFEHEEGDFDLVFSRWVLSFLPDVASVVKRLGSLLRPGGVLAIEDYNHYGVSLFPESAGFDAAIRATRALYAAGGGDTWVAGSLPAHFRAAGLEMFAYTPTVICGGPGSPAFEWADAFFPAFVDTFCERGLMTDAERELFLTDWAERRADPTSVFFSPTVVDAAARRPMEATHPATE